MEADHSLGLGFGIILIKSPTPRAWPAWTSTHQCTSWEFCPLDEGRIPHLVVGNSVHWMGWDSSSSAWMCVWPLLTFLVLTFPFFSFFFYKFFLTGFFFFPTFRSPAQLHTTHLLGLTYQLRTNSRPPFLTYLSIRSTHPFPT